VTLLAKVSEAEHLHACHSQNKTTSSLKSINKPKAYQPSRLSDNDRTDFEKKEDLLVISSLKRRFNSHPRHHYGKFYRRLKREMGLVVFFTDKLKHIGKTTGYQARRK
jgi:hypothetical protein